MEPGGQKKAIQKKQCIIALAPAMANGTGAGPLMEQQIREMPKLLSYTMFLKQLKVYKNAYDNRK